MMSIPVISRIFSPGLLALTGILWAPALLAQTYVAGIENSQWYQSGSVFECSLTHNVPGFGRAVFYHQSGETLQFYLEAQQNPMKPGQAALVVEAPPWRPGTPVQDLGAVVVEKGNKVVRLDNRKSTQILQSLLTGMMPTFTRQAWYGSESVRVRLTGINLTNMYQDHLNCVSALLPVNFQQVERNTLLFRAGDIELDDAAKAVLDTAILYLQADKSVTALYVDGHSDSTGQKISNQIASQKRAEAVMAYLVSKGVAEDIITMRYHGDRYPVTTNRTKAGRDRNRRATLRLERGTPGQASQQAAIATKPPEG